MKKAIYTIALIATVSTGYIINTHEVSSPATDIAKSNVSTVEVVTPMVKEVTQAEEVASITTEPAPVENTPVIVERTREDIWGEVFLKIQVHEKSKLLYGNWQSIPNAIMYHYDANPSLLSPELIDDTVSRCVSFYNTLTTRRDLQIMLMQHECGF